MKNILTAILLLTSHFWLPAQIHFTNQVQEWGIRHFKTSFSIGNGVSFVDFDGDGLDDITLGTQNKQFLEFYRNTGEGFERLIPPLVPHRDEAKQVVWVDADNDGDLDLYVNGTAKIGEMNNRSSVFYENKGGRFTVPECGMASDSSRSYVNVIGDVNMDGYPDIFVQNDPPSLHHFWINDGGDNQWIKVHLTGVLSNRDAIGARIEVYSQGKYQMRYRHTAIGFMGQNSNTEIIGLGTAETVDSIVVIWPSGHIDRLYDQSAGQILRIREGSTTDGQIVPEPGLNLVITSTTNLEPVESVQLYPNPVREEIHLEFPDAQNRLFEIMDTRGRTLSRGLIRSAQASLPLERLPSGVYLIRIVPNEGLAYLRRFIRQ